MNRLTRPEQAAVAAVLLAIGAACWVIATGYITPDGLIVRALAVAGLLALAEWAYDLAHALRTRTPRRRRG